MIIRFSPESKKLYSQILGIFFLRKEKKKKAHLQVKLKKVITRVDSVCMCTCQAVFTHVHSCTYMGGKGG